MYVAYTFALLRESGDLFNPIFGLPPLVHVAQHVSTPVALVVSLLIGAILRLYPTFSFSDLYVPLFRCRTSSRRLVS